MVIVHFGQLDHVTYYRNKCILLVLYFVEAPTKFETYMPKGF